MMREINKIRAEGTAWRITQDYCIDAPGRLPLEDIAMDRGVLCLEAQLTGCVARLVRKGNRGIIRTHIGIREEGRKRFAIAHELGHWFLHVSETQRIYKCTEEQMRQYKGSPLEVEANIFAGELLMPTALFRPLAQNEEPRLDAVKSLATLFKTSLTATGIKFVDTNKHEIILVMSTGGKVTWSKQQGNRSGLRIEKGMALHPESLAFHLANALGCSGPEVVAPEVWITQNWHERQLEVTEESWSLEGYDSVLTLLVVVETDRADEPDMVEHYELKNCRGTVASSA